MFLSNIFKKKDCFDTLENMLDVNKFKLKKSGIITLSGVKPYRPIPKCAMGALQYISDLKPLVSVQYDRRKGKRNEAFVSILAKNLDAEFLKKFYKHIRFIEFVPEDKLNNIVSAPEADLFVQLNTMIVACGWADFDFNDKGLKFRTIMRVGYDEAIKNREGIWSVLNPRFRSSHIYN